MIPDNPCGLHWDRTKKPCKATLQGCCPTRARTWTLLNQNQTCCQLHHRTMLLTSSFQRHCKSKISAEIVKCFTKKLPAPCTRRPFEGPHNFAGDPSAIKITFLGLHLFAIDVAGLHFGGINRQCTLDLFE